MLDNSFDQPSYHYITEVFSGIKLKFSQIKSSCDKHFTHESRGVIIVNFSPRKISSYSMVHYRQSKSIMHKLSRNLVTDDIVSSLIKETFGGKGPKFNILIFLNESNYHFTAHEGAPPCEIYNFSVTVTYVGATYTGAGCSVPSPVLSRMLPSLPSINYFSDSISYHLVKLSWGIYFEVNHKLLFYREHKNNHYLGLLKRNPNQY